MVEPTLQIVCYYIKTLDLSGKTYTDQTGRFPHVSSVENSYIIILYD